MMLTLEVDTDLVQTLQEQALARGESTEVYAGSLLRERLAAHERSARIDAALHQLGSANNKFSRGGMTWQEISHEGHKY